MSEEVKIPLPRSLQEIVGSLLFASETPLSAGEIRTAVRAVDAEDGENKEIMDVYKSCTSKEIDEALRGLEKALDVAGCGFQLVCSGGSYRIQTAPSCGRYVRALLRLDRPSRLGRASLETLAIIAYRQPLTRGEVEEIRGVDVSANMKTLMDLQLIRLVGKSELPGHPFLYGTTPLFLEHFGLASLQQLNDLDPTLQRSNPRQKAALYRKPQEKAETEVEKVEAEGEKGEKVEGVEKVEGEKGDEVESVEEVDEIEKDEVEGEGEGLTSEDDDLIIDDTPDEFEEEEEEEEEDEVEDEGEGEGEDE